MKTHRAFAVVLSSLVLVGFFASGCQSDAHARRNEYYQKCVADKGPGVTPADINDCKRKSNDYARTQKAAGE